MNPGSHVRRLEVVLNANGAPSGSTRSKRALTSIVNRCGGLQVLVLRIDFQSSRDNPTPYALQLLDRCNAPLQHIDLAWTTSQGDPWLFLRQFTELRVLSLRCNQSTVMWYGYGYGHPSTVTVFPQLHTIRVTGPAGSTVLSLIAHYGLPALRNLEHDLSSIAESNFFVKHGSQIRTLVLLPKEGQSGTAPKWLFSHCSSLQHLIIDSSVRAPGSKVTMNDLLQVNIRKTKESNMALGTTSAYQGWLEYLASMDCARLSRIRLTNFTVDDAFKQEIFWQWGLVWKWKMWIKLWSLSGVRFEDAAGELVRIPDNTNVW
jgi:hypothetical protein